MRHIQMDRRDGDKPFFDRLVISVLTATPRYPLAGNPIIFPSVRVQLFDDRIMKPPSAETGDSYALYFPSRPIWNIHVHERLLGQTVSKDKPHHAYRIGCANLEAKCVQPFLGYRRGGYSKDGPFHRRRHGARVHHIIAEVDSLLFP